VTLIRAPGDRKCSDKHQEFWETRRQRELQVPLYLIVSPAHWGHGQDVSAIRFKEWSMGAADSWAAFKRRCEQDPSYGRKKREDWSEASRIRQKMDKWGCYNCPFLENIPTSSGDLADGCKAADDRGIEVRRLQLCPNPRRKRKIIEIQEEIQEDAVDN
jgi:hypothetical protein